MFGVGVGVPTTSVDADVHAVEGAVLGGGVEARAARQGPVEAPPFFPPGSRAR